MPSKHSNIPTARELTSILSEWLSPFLRDPQNMNSVTWWSPETGSRDRPRDRVCDTGSMLQVNFDPGSLDAALAHPLEILEASSFPTLRNTTTYYEILRRTTKYYDVPRYTTTYYEILRRTTIYYEILRRTTKYYDVMRNTTT